MPWFLHRACTNAGRQQPSHPANDRPPPLAHPVRPKLSRLVAWGCRSVRRAASQPHNTQRTPTGLTPHSTRPPCDPSAMHPACTPHPALCPSLIQTTHTYSTEQPGAVNAEPQDTAAFVLRISHTVTPPVAAQGAGRVTGAASCSNKTLSTQASMQASTKTLRLCTTSQPKGREVQQATIIHQISQGCRHTPDQPWRTPWAPAAAAAGVRLVPAAAPAAAPASVPPRA